MLMFLKISKIDGIKLWGLPIHLLGLRVHKLDSECVLWSNNAFFTCQFRKNAKNNAASH